MLKRIFWLGAAAVGGWLIWWWLRQRQAEFGDHTPQFAPARPYAPAAPAADPDEALAPASPPAEEAPAPAIALDAPEAPPAAVAAATLDELFADEPAPPASAPDRQPAATASTIELEGYCMRCRAKRPIQGAREELSESGRRAARGTCPICGTTIFRFLASNDDDRGATQ